MKDPVPGVFVVSLLTSVTQKSDYVGGYELLVFFRRDVGQEADRSSWESSPVDQTHVDVRLRS